MNVPEHLAPKPYKLSFLTWPALALLGGCAGSEPPLTGGPDSEEAGIRYESSRQEYTNCIRNEGPGTATCDALKALYERDRAAYENGVK